MLFPSERTALREARNEHLGQSASHSVVGQEEDANRHADAADRLTRTLDRHHAECETTLASLLDPLQPSDPLAGLSDDEIRAAGGVVVYCRSFRVIGIDTAQAGAQYGRVRRFLHDWGILNESLEWYVRDVYLHLLGIPTDRVRT